MSSPSPVEPSGRGAPSADRASILRQVDAELELYRRRGETFAPGPRHTRLWNKHFTDPRSSVCGSDGRIDPRVLTSFRRRRTVIRDNPIHDPGLLRPWNLLSGRRRGERALLERCLEILRREGREALLAKYPSPEVGRPHQFRYRGYCYTHRWFKHVYMLGLMQHALGERLAPGFTALDIGAGYGIFSSLLQQEYPGSHHVLVDLPEQLLLASYFLRCYRPEARIASVEDLAQAGALDRDFVERYDFVLLPPGEYEKLAAGSIDLVSSFASLGELTRAFFRYYVEAPVFRSARFLLTANPVASSGMFADSDLTVLDYPLHDPEKRLHFALSPAFFHPYDYPTRRLVLSYELRRFLPFFEYAGVL